jgi:hypothetical protein
MYKIVAFPEGVAGVFVTDGCAKENAIFEKFIFDDLESAKESLKNV